MYSQLLGVSIFFKMYYIIIFKITDRKVRELSPSRAANVPWMDRISYFLCAHSKRIEGFIHTILARLQIAREGSARTCALKTMHKCQDITSSELSQRLHPLECVQDPRTEAGVSHCYRKPKHSGTPQPETCGFGYRNPALCNGLTATQPGH